MTDLVGIFFTYFLTAACLGLVIARVFRVTGSDLLRVLIYAAGLGPVSLAWLVAALLTIVPGRSEGFYVGVTVSVYAAMAIYGWKVAPEAWRVVKATLFPARSATYQRDRLLTSLSWLGFLLWVCIIVYAIWVPLKGNDPMEYADIARLLFQQRTTANYPFLEAAPGSGFFSITSHPLCFVTLITWSHLWHGSAESTALARVVSPMFVFYTLILLRHVAARLGRTEAVLSVLLFLATPSYFLQAAYVHIDAPRIHTFFLTFIIAAELIRQPRGLWLCLLSLATAASLFCHSISLLTLPFLGLTYLVLARVSLPKRILHMAVVSAVALLLSGSRYLENYKLFGSPVNNDVIVYGLPQIDFVSYLRASRQIFFSADRIIYGLFKGFSMPQLCGVAFWFMSIALIADYRRGPRNEDQRIAKAVVAQFYLLIVVSLLLGKDILIQNERYLMTILPFATLIASPFLARLYATSSGSRIKRIFSRRTLVITLALMTSFAAVAWLARNTYVMRNPSKSDESTALPATDAIRYLESHADRRRPVLVFQFSDFAFYSTLPFISHMDPRLLPVVQAASDAEAYTGLLNLSVDYVLLPKSMDPVLTNSPLYRVLAEPRYTRVIDHFGTTTLYQLRQVPARAVETFAATLSDAPVEVRKLPSAAFFAKVLEIPVFRTFAWPAPPPQKLDQGVRFSEAGRRRLLMKFGPLTIPEGVAGRAVVAFQVEGTGWLEAEFSEYSGGKVSSETMLWSSTSTGTTEQGRAVPRDIRRLLPLQPATNAISVRLEWYGEGELNISPIRITGFGKD